MHIIDIENQTEIIDTKNTILTATCNFFEIVLISGVTSVWCIGIYVLLINK